MKRTLITALTATMLMSTTISCGKTTEDKSNKTSSNKTTISSTEDTSKESKDESSKLNNETEEVKEENNENTEESSPTEEVDIVENNDVQASYEEEEITYNYSEPESNTSSRPVETPSQNTENNNVEVPKEEVKPTPQPEPTPEPAPEPEVTKTYTDGTYSGSATGYKGTINVEVTISDDKITNIAIVSHTETQVYMNAASNAIINSIISAQSTNVDAISSATLTSTGIINAVENALASARN